MSTSVQARRATRGFSMIELLVTVLLAGIIFAAMVPMFASALKKSAADNNRVTAINIAQDRIEKVRLLDYSDITPTKLNSAAIGPNWFLTNPPPVGGKTFTVATTVVPGPAPTGSPVPYKSVTVAVTWSESYKNGSGVWVTAPKTTTVKTVVKNPEGITVTTAPTPSSTPTAFAISVRFKYWTDVTGNSSYGVTVLRTAPTSGTISPSLVRPTSDAPLVWLNVPGGTDITYVVRCVGKHGTMNTPPFHLLSDCPLVFDTYPGG